MAGIDVGPAPRRDCGPWSSPSGAERRRGTVFWVRCLLVYAADRHRRVLGAAVQDAVERAPALRRVGDRRGHRLGANCSNAATRAPCVSSWPLALVGLCGALAVQSWRANFRYPADPRNPYAYVHTSPDVVRLAGRVKALSALHPDLESMLVAVVAGPSEQWPLPWYFRRMNRVGYWSSAEAAGPALALAPVIVASPRVRREGRGGARRAIPGGVLRSPAGRHHVGLHRAVALGPLHRVGQQVEGMSS